MDTKTTKTAHHIILKTKLERRHHELQAEIAAALEASEREDYITLAREVHDMKDEALADLVAYVRDADIARQADEIRDIKTALARLTAGTYGKCVDCGKTIAAARLDAYPTAKRCRTCQEKHERPGGVRTVPGL